MKINYPQTILKKSRGMTEAETYLGKLCDKSFLSLWSYLNPFRDQCRTSNQRPTAKGDGKELCDSLVVFENHIIIFSDKDCAFGKSDKNIPVNWQIDWSRWYKKAVKEAAAQISGAERWIRKYPDRIFLDKECTQPFPLEIPENIVFHRIIVAHGAAEACKEYFGSSGSGSLMMDSRIVGDAHIYENNKNCLPFRIGKVNSDGKYVHVFDDTTIGIIMDALDTIADFVRYLTKKEELIENTHVFSPGEEDLLAYYLQTIDDVGEHTFLTQEDGHPNSVIVEEGLWNDFSTHPSRLAQIKANEISYSWDKLIEKFAFHITNGTSYKLSHPSIKNQEEVFRHLARENRTIRRTLAGRLIDFVMERKSTERGTRLCLPIRPGGPHYLFFVLPRPKNIDDERYREYRYGLLQDYLFITKLRCPDAIIIIGIATEPGDSYERSEDLMCLDASEWTDENDAEAAALEKEFISKGLLSQRTMFKSTTNEYPNSLEPDKMKEKVKGKHRNEPCPCGSGKKIKKCCGKLQG